MEQEPKKSIQENVLSAIKAGQVHMKPKWHFVLKTILFIVGVVLVLLASLFIGSFFLFMLHQNGTWFAPAFGGDGVRELFTTLSIVFVLTATVFVILLQILVRHYSFSYGKPTLYTVIGVLVLVVGGSFLIQESHFHEGLLQEARDNRLPLAGIIYRDLGESGGQGRVTPGVITAAGNPQGFLMRDPHEHIVTVVITPQTKFTNGNDFQANDRVIVLGDREDDIITAEGIRELNPGERFLPPREDHE